MLVAAAGLASGCVFLPVLKLKAQAGTVSAALSRRPGPRGRLI